MRLAFLSGLVLVFFVFIFHISSSQVEKSERPQSSNVASEEIRELNLESPLKQSNSLERFKNSRKLNDAIHGSLKPAFYDLVAQPNDLEQIAELPETGED